METPSGFTVTGGFRKLDLTWTAAAPTVDVERYQHRLSTDGGDTWRREWTDIAGSDATTTSHTVGSLPDATTFTVELRIRAECQSLGRTNGYHVSRHGVAPSLSLVVWRLSVRPNGTEVGLRHD